ncbi:MAG TPA: DUF2330 domain-containing protein [Actinomycetota bacterium]|nr:DUF2330 domain-containing protein [Actinomycetota bacterium]
MRRGFLGGLTVLLVLVGGPALACGGLVAPNGAVTLDKTTTLAAYVDGVEHYMTAFTFRSAAKEFGSIVPLPGVPTKVDKGGRWTLQRLVEEVQPPVDADLALAAGEAQAARGVEVIQRHRVGALDVLVVKGGGTEVSEWAREHGFDLPGDASEVLDFYSVRSPIFAAIRFDSERAAREGFDAGDSAPVHFMIPTDNPWVPLRILALGTGASERVKADVFLLTEEEPSLLPRAGQPFSFNRKLPLSLERSEPASRDLLRDLRSDRGMRWLPRSGMWFSYLDLDVPAGELTWDLAVDGSGAGRPSLVDAGLLEPRIPDANAPVAWAVIAALGALTALAIVEERRLRARA